MDAKETAAPTRYSDTVEDVARHFGVTPQTVRRWTEVTDIPHRRVEAGSRTTLRFNLPEVDAWAEHGGRPAEPAPAEQAR